MEDDLAHKPVNQIHLVPLEELFEQRAMSSELTTNSEAHATLSPMAFGMPEHQLPKW